MSVRSEKGWTERPLTDAEWEALVKVFPKPGSRGQMGALAFRELGIAKSELVIPDTMETTQRFRGQSARSIQQVMNQEFAKKNSPFKIIFKNDGKVPSGDGGFRPVNPRIVLMCKEEIAAAGKPEEESAA